MVAGPLYVGVGVAEGLTRKGLGATTLGAIWSGPGLWRFATGLGRNQLSPNDQPMAVALGLSIELTATGDKIELAFYPGLPRE